MSEKGKIKAPLMPIKELDKLVLKSGDGLNTTLKGILRRGAESWCKPLLSNTTLGVKEQPPKEICHTDPATGKKWVFIVPQNLVGKETVLSLDLKDLEMHESPDGKTVTVSVKPK